VHGVFAAQIIKHSATAFENTLLCPRYRFYHIKRTFSADQKSFVTRQSFFATMSADTENPWEVRWQKGQTGWDKGESNPTLVELLKGPNSSVPKGRALVPGCGAGYDVITFASYGWKATGLDFSKTGIEKAKKVRADAGVSEGQAELVYGDFFKYDFGFKFDAIYDYTFLCALDPPMRESWADRMAELVAPTGELITMIYPVDDTIVGGPPFRMSPDIVKGLLEPRGFKAIYLEPVTNGHSSRAGKEWLGRWRKQV